MPNTSENSKAILTSHNATSGQLPEATSTCRAFLVQVARGSECRENSKNSKAGYRQVRLSLRLVCVPGTVPSPKAHRTNGRIYRSSCSTTYGSRYNFAAGRRVEHCQSEWILLPRKLAVRSCRAGAARPRASRVPAGLLLEAIPSRRALRFRRSRRAR